MFNFQNRTQSRRITPPATRLNEVCELLDIRADARMDHRENVAFGRQIGVEGSSHPFTWVEVIFKPRRGHEGLNCQFTVFDRGDRRVGKERDPQEVVFRISEGAALMYLNEGDGTWTCLVPDNGPEWATHDTNGDVNPNVELLSDALFGVLHAARRLQNTLYDWQAKKAYFASKRAQDDGGDDDDRPNGTDGDSGGDNDEGAAQQAKPEVKGTATRQVKKATAAPSGNGNKGTATSAPTPAAVNRGQRRKPTTNLEGLEVSVEQLAAMVNTRAA